MTAESIKLEYKQLAKMAPHGVSAFVVCVPHGRFTQEQEETLKDLVTICVEINQCVGCTR